MCIYIYYVYIYYVYLPRRCAYIYIYIYVYILPYIEARQTMPSFPKPLTSAENGPCFRPCLEFWNHPKSDGLSNVEWIVIFHH